MAEVKVSALTALTGANVANGDELLINDVGSPNVSKKITADELAQATQFSSRYKPLASDTIWLDPRQFVIGNSSGGVPTLSALYVGAGWQLDKTDNEQLQTNVYFPPSWNSFSVEVWWSNIVGGGAGDVCWRLYYAFQAPGDDYQSGLIQPTQVVAAAGAQRIIIKTTLDTGRAITSGNMLDFTIFRFGSDASDTLDNDCNLHGVLLTRAS